jgi:hypothetical protein
MDGGLQALTGLVCASISVEESVENAARLSKWLDDRIHRLTIGSGVRERLAAGCLDQVLEHYKGIQVLLKKSLPGSAFALLRPIFEIFVRGLWLLHCASANEVERFRKDKVKKSIGDLIKEIEGVDGYRRGQLSKIKKRVWVPMSSYAHGGYLPVARRNTNRHIKANYRESEKLELVQLVELIAMLAALEIFSLAKRQDLAIELGQRLKY